MCIRDSYGDDSATVELSYEEVDQRSNQLARYLIDRGVGPDAVVAVMLEPSADRIISILGIMKAGGAYLPLDP